MGIKLKVGGIPIHKVSNIGTTLTDIYTVPTGKRAMVSFTICNRDGANKSFRVAISPLGITIANSHYIYYDRAMSTNETIDSEKEYHLMGGDIVRFYGSTTDVSFTINGIEY